MRLLLRLCPLWRRLRPKFPRHGDPCIAIPAGAPLPPEVAPAGVGDTGETIMTFLHAIKAIGHGIEVGLADVSSPAVQAIASAVPGFGPEAAAVLKLVYTVEALIPGSKLGAAKKAAVTAIATANTPSLAVPASAAQLSKQIDSLVAALNAVQTALAAIPGA